MDRLPRLVIFDCDGVLVDSEIISSRIFTECLAEAGIVLTLDEAMAFGVGKSSVTLAAAVAETFGLTLPAGFIAAMRARVMHAFSSELRAIDGIPALLAALTPKRCVASNSHIDRVRHALAVTGLLPHLEPHIYTAAMVGRGKPAPDLFLFAAGQHGVRPDDCLVIEDSLSGVSAAHAAGMPVIGFVGGSHCRPGHADAMRAAGCLRVFARMAEVAAFLYGIPQRGRTGRGERCESGSPAVKSGATIWRGSRSPGKSAAGAWRRAARRRRRLTARSISADRSRCAGGMRWRWHARGPALPQRRGPTKGSSNRATFILPIGRASTTTRRTD